MDRVRPSQSFERPREVDDLLRDGIVLDRVRELGARLERLLERLPWPLGDHLRQPVDGAVRDLEHAAGIAHGRPGRHRGEGDDLRHPIAPILLGHVVDHPFSPLDREVDVHVGHVLPGRVEEPLEQQPVAQRIDVGDPECVRGEGARGAAAAGPDGDTVALRERDEVGHDQEVVGEPHLPHRFQLELETLDELRGQLVVALREPGLAELDEVVEGVAALRRRELRQQDPAELDLDVAAVGDLERAPHRVLVPGEVEGHLLRRLEVELVGSELPVVGVLQRVARLDAEERLVRVGVGRVEVVHVTRRDERQPALRRQPRQRLEDGLLDVEVAVLQLHVGVVAAEDLLEPVELHLGVAHSRLGDRFRDPAGETTGERDQPRRILLEKLPVHARAVVVALEVAERAELDQIGVAGRRLREQRQVRRALHLLVPVVRDIDLAPENRLHALLVRRLVEIDRARERAVVGERDGGHLEPRRLVDECRNPAGAVENGVLGVDVQVDEGGRHRNATLLRGADVPDHRQLSSYGPGRLSGARPPSPSTPPGARRGSGGRRRRSSGRSARARSARAGRSGRAAP